MPLTPLHCKYLSFSHPILTSFQADSSVSNVSVAPLLAFNPVDGHLPLQPYQSGANMLCVPLTHPVTLTFLPCHMLLSQPFCQGWALQALPITCCVPQMICLNSLSEIEQFSSKVGGICWDCYLPIEVVVVTDSRNEN